MSNDCHLPTYLWSEAVSHAQYLINRSPTRTNHGATPEAKYTGKTPDISNLKIFGCVAYVHVPKERRKKLDSRAIQCLFMDFDSETKAYRLYDQSRHKIIISQDVIFDETKVGLHHLKPSQPAENTVFSFSSQTDTKPRPLDLSEQTGSDEPTLADLGCVNSPTEIWKQNLEAPSRHLNRTPDIRVSTYPDDRSENELGPMTTDQLPRPVPEPSGPPNCRYPTCLRNPSLHLKDFWSFYSELLDEPLTYADAVQQEGWRKAIQSEIDSIMKNKTWTITDRPTDHKPITAKWLFKIKRHSNGLINKLKARIVARGFQQKEGTDYSEVFAPVVKWSTILTVLALAAKQNWPLWQMDVITAFLNGTINEDLFMEIPDGFPGADDPTQVCKINRALYGLKQSPKAWYDRISAWLCNHGLTRSKSDPNMYYSKNDHRIVILLLYVDDLLITGNDDKAINTLKQRLQHEFEMTDLGEAQQYLGVEISRHPNGIFLNQEGYISKLLKKFNLRTCNPTKLPIDPKLQLSRNMGTSKTDPKEYRSLVGSLIYLSHTRPNISYAIGSVARYMQDPEVAHFQAAKKILRYLSRTVAYGLLLDSRSNNYTLSSYTDADWGRDVDTRRSVSGILHNLGNTSIAWSSKLQPTVSLSSTEAEYRVLTDTAKDVIYFQRLL